MAIQINPHIATLSGQHAILKNSSTNTIQSKSQTNNYEGIVLSDSLKEMMKNYTNEVKRLVDQPASFYDKDLENMQWDKTGIMSQASQAITAQANQSPQAVLRLLS